MKAAGRRRYLWPVSARPVLALLHYDGAHFAGWQRQPRVRTVQAELEAVLQRLTGRRTVATGAGRTDAGVHALGQAVSFVTPDKWGDPDRLRPALNALLPADVWVERIRTMRAGFDARRHAVGRRYRYLIGTDEHCRSPFRRPYEWALGRALDRPLLDRAAALLLGEHAFHGLAAAHAATTHYRCRVALSTWAPRTDRWGGAGMAYTIEADRFLQRMVRFLVGTMVDIALGRRALADLRDLLVARENQAASPPAPPQGLYLEAVRYPAEAYADPSASRHPDAPSEAAT